MEDAMAVRKRKDTRRSTAVAKSATSAKRATRPKSTGKAKRAKSAGTGDAPEVNDAAAPHSGAATLIYVHGIGNKPPASILKAQWDRALFEFDLGERSRMAYWVDRDRYPVPVNDVTTGGDFSDATEE